ncbi:MAG: VTT domain-containing protein, partial [Victivallales bacterium]|nr:VTT domain-containing protein [Victivallales bacterium]
MTIEKIIAEYGYYAIPLAVIILGNAVIFAAGILAHHGVLEIPMVIICAFIGGFIISQLLFYFGGFFIKKERQNKNKEVDNEKTINGIKEKFNRSPFSVILFSRLIPGFRFIAPIVIGLLKYNKIKFLIYDIIAVIIITVLLVFLGFCFGHALESFFFKTKEY